MMERAIVEFQVKKHSLIYEAKEAIDQFIMSIEREEPGTLTYASMQDKNDPAHFIHYMEFHDEDSHQTHRKSKHVQEFVSKLYPLCAEEPIPIFLECYREISRR